MRRSEASASSRCVAGGPRRCLRCRFDGMFGGPSMAGVRTIENPMCLRVRTLRAVESAPTQTWMKQHLVNLGSPIPSYRNWWISVDTPLFKIPGTC